MNINPINISLLKPQTHNNQKNYGNFGIINTNLAPLKKDTVSFSASAKLSGESMLDAPNARLCSQVYDNAQPAAYYLEKVLNKYLEPLNAKKSNGEPLFTVTTRTKSAKSIRDKVASKFNKIAKSEMDEFCDAAVNELFKYFEPQNGFTKEMAKVQAKILMDFESYTAKIPPYQNELLLLVRLAKDLEDRNLMKFNSSSPEDKIKAFAEMEENLTNITKSEHSDKNGAYIDPATIKGTKHYANDIVGARIILNDSNPKLIQKIFDALRKASDDNALNITSVESNVPSAKKLPKGAKVSDYEYLSSRRLKTFSDNTNAQYRENESKSGYLSIHVNVDLSNDMLKSDKNKFNGYTGEIQIMDSNIEQLKEVEDLCYKLKDNKNNIGKKYTEFKKHFKKFYKEQSVKDAFDDYTYKLYLNQRRKSFDKSSKTNKFATIQDMGYQGIIPPELDYNLLKDIKELCERKENNYTQVANLKNLDKVSFSDEIIKQFHKLIFSLNI